MEYYLSNDKNRESISSWYRKRRTIFLILCYESLLYGIELTILEPTEYFYYKDILRVASPLVCYSLALTLNVFSTLLSNILVSYIVKRYSISSDTMLLLTFLSTIGHCLYFVTNIPVVIVMSRFIAGLGKSTNIISASMIQMLYSEQELAVKTATLSNFVTIGTVIGPMLTYIFININFNIGTLNFNYGNTPGFYMALWKFIFFVVTFVFLEDIPSQNDRDRFTYEPRGKIEAWFCRCKAEEDANEHLIRKYDVDDAFDEVPAPNITKKKVPVTEALGEVVFNNHASLIFTVIAIHGVAFKVINSLIPVVSSAYFSWNIEKISALCLGNSLLGTIMSVIMAYCFLNSTHYLNLIGGMAFGLFSLVLLSTVRIYGNDNKPASVLFCFMSVFNVLSSCLVAQSARMVLIHITDKSLRSFADALRTCLLEASFVIGSLLILVVNEEFEVSGFVAVFVMLITIGFIMLKLRHIWV